MLRIGIETLDFSSFLSGLSEIWHNLVSNTSYIIYFLMPDKER